MLSGRACVRPVLARKHYKSLNILRRCFKFRPQMQFIKVLLKFDNAWPWPTFQDHLCKYQVRARKHNSCNNLRRHFKFRTQMHFTKVSLKFENQWPWPTFQGHLCKIFFTRFELVNTLTRAIICAGTSYLVHRCILQRSRSSLTMRDLDLLFKVVCANTRFELVNT